ncbi:MAG: YHYH protein [Reichenbachiella sp.]|uniref:YHYH protein n=1 Tax=Reichenbachiella sp. TaxID=2184521 RepID=UPI0032632A0F
MKRNKTLLKLTTVLLITLGLTQCDSDEDTGGTTGGDDTSIFVEVLATQQGTEDGDAVIFTINLIDDSGDAVTNETGSAVSADVTFSGTSDADDFDTDFVSTVSIDDGESSTTIELDVTDDDEIEEDETLIITLSDPSEGTLETASASATITDNDELAIDISTVTTQNGAEGGDDIIFTISLLDPDGNDYTNDTGDDITVDIEFSGTATYSKDIYDDMASSVSIADGASNTTLTLSVQEDGLVESTEDLVLTLSNPSAGSLKDDEATATITDNDESAPDMSVLSSKFYHSDAITFSFNETTITINSDGLPDHKSMYYNSDDDLYEAYDEPDNDDFKKNPGEIESQDLVFEIPRYPAEASSHASTPMGPMGVSVNSVVLFNQNAAGDDDIFEELNTFDQYEGHPAGALYHYHIDPVWLTQSEDNEDADPERFIGFLLDGFPVYGPEEDGIVLTNDDLDDYHGHNGATADFPNGVYHYHVTDDYPWINGDGFYGTSGTVSQ